MENNFDQNVSPLRALFDRGAAAANDPANDLAIQQSGKAITTLRSFWLHQACPTCAHSFRVGDGVQIAPDGTIKHDSALLPCAHGVTFNSEISPETTAFFAGLDEAWPPPPDLRVLRLEAGHPLLAPPHAGFKRRICAVCGHTLRVNDHVVICPCSPLQPLCQAAIHRDPVHGLHCLEAWNPGINQPDKQRHCPITSRNIA